jgi:hypothetical protein
MGAGAEVGGASGTAAASFGLVTGALGSATSGDNFELAVWLGAGTADVRTFSREPWYA